MDIKKLKYMPVYDIADLFTFKDLVQMKKALREQRDKESQQLHRKLTRALRQKLYG